MLPEKMLMTTSKDRNILIKNRKLKFEVKTGNRTTSAWKWMNLLRHAPMQNKDDNNNNNQRRQQMMVVQWANLNRWPNLHHVEVLFKTNHGPVWPEPLWGNITCL